jgi:PAS domain S-box-containing protein
MPESPHTARGPSPGPRTQETPHSWIGEVVCQSDEYAVIRVSLDGVIEGWFGAAPRLFGYSMDEAVGQPFSIIFTPADIDRRLHEVELEIARHTGRSEDDRWHVRKDGARFWGSGVVNPVHDGQHQHIGYSKLLRDRTDLRIRYEALQNRLHHLAHQVARKQEALSTLVHELRNPLAPMVNAARIVDSEVSQDIKQRMLGVIVRQTEVIQRVLDEAGQGLAVRIEPLHVRPVVLQDALRASVDTLMFDARTQGLELALVCPPTPITIEVDPARLQQMVINLLSNAIKYNHRGGHVTVSASVESDMAVVRVDDDGDGIAQENIERVFELFTREDHNEAVSGLGVGLAVVKRLAWMHGGFVEARSPGKGGGSQFTLQLPLLFPGTHSAPLFTGPVPPP